MSAQAATLLVDMGATGREPTRVRCARCGDIIGVYEPLVHVIDGIAHRTSRAANPDIVNAGPVYHLACSELDGTEPIAVD